MSQRQRPKAKIAEFMTTGRWLLLGLTVVVVVYGGWYMSTHERVSVSEYRPKIEAASNPYYAAEVLLNHHGKSAEFFSGGAAGERLADVWQQSAPEAKRTVVLLSDDHVAVPADMDKMVAWLRAGGHLIVQDCPYYVDYDDDELTDIAGMSDEEVAAVQDETRDSGRLLKYLGVVCGASMPASEDISSPFADELDTRMSLLKMNDVLVVVSTSHNKLDDSRLQRFFKDDVSPYADYRAAWQYMKKSEVPELAAALTEEEWLAFSLFMNANPDYYQPEQMLIDVNFGKGRLTVINSDSAFDNPYTIPDFDKWLEDNEETQAENAKKPKSSALWAQLSNKSGYTDKKGEHYQSGIASADHGYLLMALVGERDEVLLVGRSDRPSLLRLMWRNTRFMLLAMLATLLLSLLMLPRQFGRRQVYRDEQGRNYLRYFELLGDYLWAADKLTKQVTDNRDRLMERLKARLPMLAAASTPEAICQLIAEDAKLPAETVYLALYGTWQNDSEFISISDAFVCLVRCYDGHA